MFLPEENCDKTEWICEDDKGTKMKIKSKWHGWKKKISNPRRRKRLERT
jgi:hypothetical protein